ncbi:MAG: type II secretion system protein N [bacterium]
MAALDIFRRGWGWVWLLACVELALVGSEALPLLHPTATTRTVQPAQKPISPARVSLQPILDFHPFGAPEPPPPDIAPPDPVIEPDTPPPPVTDGYVLQGVLYREDGAPSRAILAWNGGPPATFVSGDTLPSGATLAGIEANRVWLELDGDRQFLEFPGTGVTPNQETTGSELPDQNDPSADTGTQTIDAKPAPPATQIMPQPDLRNLIPGLVATPPDQN